MFITKQIASLVLGNVNGNDVFLVGSNFVFSNRNEAYVVQVSSCNDDGEKLSSRLVLMGVNTFSLNGSNVVENIFTKRKCIEVLSHNVITRRSFPITDTLFRKVVDYQTDFCLGFTVDVAFSPVYDHTHNRLGLLTCYASRCSGELTFVLHTNEDTIVLGSYDIYTVKSKVESILSVFDHRTLISNSNCQFKEV